MTESSGREWLREIARRAMKQPDFPPAVLAETAAVTQPAARPTAPPASDLLYMKTLPFR